MQSGDCFENETSNEVDGVDASSPLDVKQRRLSMKVNPKMLSDVLHNLSASQKEWVVKTGFGQVFHLNMTSYPPYMGFSELIVLTTLIVQ